MSKASFSLSDTRILCASECFSIFLPRIIPVAGRALMDQKSLRPAMIRCRSLCRESHTESLWIFGLSDVRFMSFSQGSEFCGATVIIKHAH